MKIIGFICTIIVLTEIGYVFYQNLKRWLGVEDKTTVVECTEEDLKLLNEIKERRKNNET
jgi:hypothetical protein